jgi:2-oxoglutarate ferredoxin oxidoreductase subunit delta
MPMIEILDDICKGCLLCIPACPHSLIQNTQAKINRRGHYPVEFIDLEHVCNGCKLCAITCPDVAIVVYKEVKKKAS